MISWVRSRIDAFLGQGNAAVTVPPMDGALSPNTHLDRARLVASILAPDDLAEGGGTVFFSSGNTVFWLDPESGTSEPVRSFTSSVACLAALGNTLAVGLAKGGIYILRDGEEIAVHSMICPTAMTFLDPDTLLATQGSTINGPGHWKQDLMQRGTSGSVWEVSVKDGTVRVLASGLAWPNGIAATHAGIIVSESWRHRLIRLDGSSSVPVLADLPGYPARLSPAHDGGWWLSVFAPRGQLCEFVLRERRFCNRMMAEIDPEHWLAPAITTPKSFLEPMMGGALRTQGFVKPWAPTRSYGLLVHLDSQFRPIRSFHSRADGSRHGVTAALDLGTHVLVVARGGDAILEISSPAAGDLK
jgi:hypothetical protein